MDASARHGRHGDGDAREKAKAEDEADLAAAPPTSDDAPNTSGLDESVSEWTGQTAGKPQCYFIVHNIAKKHNVGTIARCATAFGVRSVVLIGSKSYNTFGCKGSSNHVDFAYYPTLKDARAGLTTEKKVTKILGVEICEGAVPIESHPFDGDTAFIMGNEGDGMTENQKAICDGFVYIRQHGPGTASLNVSVAASIVMHHFALWARYDERAREGEKYVVQERRVRTHKRGIIGEDPEEVRARRAAAREAREQAEAEAEAGGTPGIEF